MKLDIKDIVLLNEGQQAKKLIVSKFGSLKNFSESVNTRGLSLKAIQNYCCYPQIHSNAFKILLIDEFNLGWDEIILDDTAQIRKYVYNLFENVFLYKDDSDLRLIEKLEELTVQYGMTNERAIILRCKAKYNYFIGDSIKTINLYKDALNLVSDKYLDTAIILNVELADHFYFEKMNNDANIYYDKAESYINDSGISDYALYTFYYRKGVMYNSSGQHEKAREYFEKSINYASINTETMSQAGASLMAIGTAYKRENKLNDAKGYYFRSLLYFNENDINGRGSALNNISDIYCLLSDYENAIKYIKDALKLFEKEGISGKYLLCLETYAETKYLAADFSGCYQYFDILKKSYNTSINKNVIKNSMCNFIDFIGNNDILKLLESLIVELISSIKNEAYKEDLFSCLGRLNMKLRYKEV